LTRCPSHLAVFSLLPREAQPLVSESLLDPFLLVWEAGVSYLEPGLFIESPIVRALATVVVFPFQYSHELSIVLSPPVDTETPPTRL